MTPLLEMFLTEAGDLIADASQGLVALERARDDAEVLNQVFRSFHTLKGSSGMFPFGALTRLLHAVEDVLSAVRAHDAELTPALVDVLLACTDRVGRWLENIADTEALPPDADADSASLSTQVRAALQGVAREADGSPAPAARSLDELPPALRALAAAALEAGDAPLSVRYQPCAKCFFWGDNDPLKVVRGVPKLLGLALVEPEAGWGELAHVDPFACHVGFELLSCATAAELAQVFAYVSDEVEVRAVGGATPESDDRAVFEGILRDQAHLLGLPCASEELLGRILGVASTVTACLTEMKRAGEIAAWQSAVSEATRTLHTDGLVAVIARMVSRRPAATEPEAPTAAQHAHARDATTVKVSLDRIDDVMNLVGELVIAKNALPYIARRVETQYGMTALARELADQYAVLNRIAQALQSAVMQVRMLPLASVFQRFPRVVRDLSRKLEKDVELALVGEDIEADKSIIDRINEPLIHLVRNSLDHGIEAPAARVAAGKPARGTITLAASHDGDSLVIELTDDGRGLDPGMLKRKAIERGVIDEARAATLTDAEAMNLIFAAGFSTAAATSDVSGRGVGMDVVRQTIEELGGDVALRSEKGRGTCVRLSLPLTMAVTRVLMVRAGAEKYGVPMDAVLGVVRRPRAEFGRVMRRDVLDWRGRLVPLFELGRLLQLDEPEDGSAEAAILMLDVAGHEVGVVVDAFDADAEVVLKPLEGILAGCRTFHGTAILGDGRTLLVLNPKELLTCRPDTTAYASA